MAVWPTGFPETALPWLFQSPAGRPIRWCGKFARFLARRPDGWPWAVDWCSWNSMHVEDTGIPAVKIVTPKKHGDARGFFSEVYNKASWQGAGLSFDFVQDNHSFSAGVGTLRGLHFQIPPFAQDKLVRVARGR